MFHSILRYDYLKITNENDEIFGVVCGEQPGENVVVIGNYVQLIFHSDSEVQKKGFLISFTAVPRSGEYNKGDTGRRGILGGALV